MNAETPFETFLDQHDEEAWSATVAALLRSVHEVDKAATQIWFAFYPLGLFYALQQAEDRETLARQLLIQGSCYLKDQIDSSHTFFYGHRYWPEVKKTVEQAADSFDPSATGSLADHIIAVASDLAARLKVDQSLLVGITAVAFMTVRQSGLAAFKAARGEIAIDHAVHVEQVALLARIQP